MRFDVETGSCDEAFDHCLWDETMDSLSYLDMIERSFRLDPNRLGIPWNHIERQIEGSSFWTLMGMDSQEDYPGCIEWTGRIPQGNQDVIPSDDEGQQLLESLAGDSHWAFDFLSKAKLLTRKWN